jgi:beta-lactam-binding protein with PASTA domain
MKNQQPGRTNATEDDALIELTSVLPAGDRLRFAALGRISSLSVAKQKSLLREEKTVVARYGADSPEAKSARRRLDVERRFDTAVKVETERTQAEVVSRNREALTIHGRLVNPRRLAVRPMTVSATDEQGKAVAYSVSDSNGYFALQVPASDNTRNENVTLLVSDENRAVFYRGTECFARVPGRILYRELVIATVPILQPTPPPDVDPKSVTVPDVRGLQEDIAIAHLKTVGLLVDVTTKEAGDDNVGRVIDQTPQPGVKVAPCSRVGIVVGVAQTKVTVPDVTGSLDRARGLIAQANLVVGKIEPPAAPDTGIVTAQEPKADDLVAPGTAVNLQVRVTPPNVSVPNVLQSSLSAAGKSIIEAGLIVGNVQPADASDESIVVEQAPIAGGDVRPGSAVNLVVEAVEVPNLVRLTAEQARELLGNQKLKLGKISFQAAADDQLGRVISQAPKAGSLVAPQSEVAIVLGAKEGDESISERSSATIIRRMAEEPDFVKIGASEAKLLRLAEEEGIKSENDLLKIADGEDAAVRDRFKLRKLKSARAFKEILLRVTKRD